MNNRVKSVLLFALLVSVSLACQITQVSNEEGQVIPTNQIALPTSTPKTEVLPLETTSIPQSTDSPTIEITPTSEPQATVLPTPHGPEEVKTAYLEALMQQDFEQVATLVSNYSLSISRMNRQDIVSTFEKKNFEGWRMVGYRVVESRTLDEQSALVHVMTKEQNGENEPQNYDFWSALRKEDGQWRVNWNLLVDDVSLNIEPQTINNLSAQPVRIVRYTDKMSLGLHIENTNKRGCFWGWVGDEVATFHFNNQVVGVSGNLKIEPERIYPDAYVNINGFFESFPIAVDLSKWQWAHETLPNLPEPGGNSWEYHFELQTDTP